MQRDYHHQHDGINQYGVPYIAGQNLANAMMDSDDPQNDRSPGYDQAQETAADGVTDLARMLAALGFASLAEMRAAAADL